MLYPCLKAAIHASHSLGKVAPGSVISVVKEVSEEEIARKGRIQNRPPLQEILNLHDFEVRKCGPLFRSTSPSSGNPH